MKVIDNALRGIIFGSLGVGATFKHGKSYFIKIMRVSCLEGSYNAVDLEDGRMHCFHNETPVIPFDCELIIL